MARNEQQAILKSIVDLTPSVKELTIKTNGPFSFLAGQFVMLIVPAEPKPALRAYSIASPPGEGKDEFKLVIKHFYGGVASEWVKTLKGGETLKLTGPFGKFLFRQPTPKQVVMVCTSTGLAPLYSMVASLDKKTAEEVHFKFIMGVWNEQEIFYTKELDAVKKALPHFDYEFVLDEGSPSWKGEVGRVTGPISKLDLNIPTEFYLCGNPNMIKAVKDQLAEKNFPKEKIHTESYG